MARIRPFAAYRPAAGLEREIAALPYDVYNRREAREEVQRNPGSFLAIDRAETGLGEDTDIYAPKVYRHAASLLEEWIGAGRFVQDQKPCYYLYEQTMNGRSQTGIVACASIDDYLNNVIKRHENTREDKERDRIRHVDACSMQTGPIFLAYRASGTLKELTARAKGEDPVCSFVSEDGIRHRVWVVDDDERIARICRAFEQIPAIYIADGHHRCASAVKVGLKRRQEHPDYTGEEAFHYFLAVLFPDDELRILDYNRVVRDLNGYTAEEFLERAAEHFSVERALVRPFAPDQKGVFGMCLGGVWYRLAAREEIRSQDEVKGLDVSLLQDYLLGPVLGIRDPRTDGRIDFVGGIRGLEELERRALTDGRVAFALYPTSMEELERVADAGKLMPPKSTWFEPKLRSGLFLHSLETRETGDRQQKKEGWKDQEDEQ